MSMCPSTSPRLKHSPPRAQVAHVEYYEMKQARQFTDDTILELEFAGLFILKHHFSLHSAHDIREAGPPRHRTALMFENKLQWVKRAAKRTNFKNPIFAVVDQWSVCTARELARLQNASRHEIEVVYASDVCVTSASLLAQYEEGLDEHVSSMLRLLLLVPRRR